MNGCGKLDLGNSRWQTGRQTDRRIKQLNRSTTTTRPGALQSANGLFGRRLTTAARHSAPTVRPWRGWIVTSHWWCWRRHGTHARHGRMMIITRLFRRIFSVGRTFRPQYLMTSRTVWTRHCESARLELNPIATCRVLTLTVVVCCCLNWLPLHYSLIYVWSLNIHEYLQIPDIYHV